MNQKNVDRTIRLIVNLGNALIHLKPSPPNQATLRMLLLSVLLGHSMVAQTQDAIGISSIEDLQKIAAPPIFLDTDLR